MVLIFSKNGWKLLHFEYLLSPVLASGNLKLSRVTRPFYHSWILKSIFTRHVILLVSEGLIVIRFFNVNVSDRLWNLWNCALILSFVLQSVLRTHFQQRRLVLLVLLSYVVVSNISVNVMFRWYFEVAL